MRKMELGPLLLLLLAINAPTPASTFAPACSFTPRSVAASSCWRASPPLRSCVLARGRGGPWGVRMSSDEGGDEEGTRRSRLTPLVVEEAPPKGSWFDDGAAPPRDPEPQRAAPRLVLSGLDLNPGPDASR